jgi:hypothetical protein
MTPKEFEIMLSDAEIQLSRVKHLYEQYFQGIERIEPQIPRKQFDRMLHQLRKTQPRNTALRFRFQTLIQRYTTLQTYWRRIARQIEEGTYRRDLLRARKRREAARAERDSERRRGSTSPLELDPNQDVNLDRLIEDATERVDELLKAPTPSSEGDKTLPPKPAPTQEPATATFSRPKAKPPLRHKAETPVPRRDKSSPGIAANRRTPPAIAARSKGPGEARMRQIYESYVEAKRRNNERTDKIDYETVAKSLKKMVPKLDRKHKGKRIDFKVVVKDGKVGLKPVVKK